jgi:hypothetical protein
MSETMILPARPAQGFGVWYRVITIPLHLDEAVLGLYALGDFPTCHTGTQKSRMETPGKMTTHCQF